MKYVPPLDSTDPNAGYVDGDDSTSTGGSVVPAAGIEHPQREILAVIEAAGIEPSGDDLGQLNTAINQKISDKAVPAATTEVAGIVRLATAEEVAEKTEPNAAVSPADLAGLDGMPVGALLDLYGDDSEAPPGYLLCNGAAVTATYPELRAFGLSRGWQVNANGDPLLPDSGGYFRRGIRTGQLVDSGRVFGTVQGDAYAEHDHVGTAGYGSAGASPNGKITAAKRPSIVVATLAENYAGYTGAAGGTETRPANYTCTTWIKAYAAATSPGSIDLANLVNDITDVEQRIAALENRLGYAVLYPGGTEAAPGTISSNQRIVIDNPFGAAPCRVEAEVQIDGLWGNPGHYTDNAVRTFVAAHTFGGSVVIRSGSSGTSTLEEISGRPSASRTAYGTLPYRVKIWKLAGAA